jgi:HD superfamily phosphohydrolase
LGTLLFFTFLLFFTTAYTYINANHTRFEHCIGVAHLAEAIGKKLQEHQPTLHITSKDIVCIKLAGLLHDIGHGPFSHVYESFWKEYRSTVPQDLIDKYGPLPEKWDHEEASMMMIDAALEDLGLAIDLHCLDQPLKQIGDGIDATSMRIFTADDRTQQQQQQQPDANGQNHRYNGSNGSSQQPSCSELILTSRDWIFIKECIAGAPLPEVQHTLGVADWIGRSHQKEFLYDIVHNRHSGLDVDKLGKRHCQARV